MKYINAYKIIVTFEALPSAEKLISCQSFKDKGWKIYKTWEVGGNIWHHKKH